MFLFVLLVVKVCPFGSLVGGLTLAAMCCVIKQQFPTSWQRLGFTVKQAENEYFCGGKFLISRTGLVMCNKQKKGTRARCKLLMLCFKPSCKIRLQRKRVSSYVHKLFSVSNCATVLLCALPKTSLLRHFEGLRWCEKRGQKNY